MRKWARVKNGYVIQVLESEDISEIASQYDGDWIEAVNAEAGYSYDADLNRFIPPKLYESLVLDESSLVWNPPVPVPDDAGSYSWEEETTSWVVQSD